MRRPLRRRDPTSPQALSNRSRFMRFAQRCSVFVAAMFMALLTGCASVQMASADADARAKTFEVPKDKASIYVFRHENFGGAVPMTVALDGKVAGQTGAKTYFLFEVAPGQHEVTSVAENNSALTLNAEPG